MPGPRKLRVYVAGAYSAPNITNVMANMRRGLKVSAAILKDGFAVYSPWTDCLLHFHEEFTLEECYSYSMPWLDVSDIVFLIRHGHEQSRGVQAELKRADELGIPVVSTYDALMNAAQHILAKDG